MTVQYLSYFLSESTPAYGGEKETVRFTKTHLISSGNTSNNLRFEFPAHIGTHIDFPYHFSNEGKKSSDYPPSFWIFDQVGFLNCAIGEVPEAIKTLESQIEILILRTGFGKQRNHDNYWSQQPIIPAAYASLFRSRFPKLRVFGFDMISMTSKLDRPEGKRAHEAFLLENDILILEDMQLESLVTCPKRIIVAPLLVCDADGVACNVMAFI